MTKYTPMIEQYLAIKKNYQDAFLFYRLGDFYEMFFSDAVKAAKELEITLTKRRGGNNNEEIAMCGVPYHSAQSYIEILITKGYKVAICEQVSDPKAGKGIVKREVVQVITAGTLMEGRALLPKENNYIASLTELGANLFGVATVDLTTGEQKVIKITSGFTGVLNELTSFLVKEVVVAEDFARDWQQKLKKYGVLLVSYENEVATSYLIGSELEDGLKKTCGRLLSYMQKTQKRSLDHLQKVKLVNANEYLAMDYFARKHLELTMTIRGEEKKGSLLWLLDKTQTAMGGRKLKEWLQRPLFNKAKINKRHELVATLVENFFIREQIRDYLSKIYDLERVAGRVAFGNCTARDLRQLCLSLEQIPHLQAELLDSKLNSLCEFGEQLDPCLETQSLLARAIATNPPILLKDGGVIKDGYSLELDKLRDATNNGKNWVVSLEQEERKKTGIRSLKIKYNRIFGYYFEVTKANLTQLKDSRFIRKQTLANSERFVTEELKEIETTILSAEEKSNELEAQLFAEVLQQVKNTIIRIQKLASNISEIDVLQCFATISEENNFIRPELTDERELVIKNGRHPVVEKVLSVQTFVANDVFFRQKDREVLLLTGPNMSGKSTYMRQIAQIVILNQIGCFVPCERAMLPLFDQIFTRIGATDDLLAGQSTFMVEMMEANNALRNASNASLLLFDEIGRGTATYDGMALAQAIIEHVHEELRAFTLFSTHYHELTELEAKLGGLANIHVRAIEEGGKVVFLHQVQEGASDRSYGIHVAELVEMPPSLIKRAREILYILESNAATKEPPKQASDFASRELKSEHELAEQKLQASIIADLRSIDVMNIAPLKAMEHLLKLQEKLKGLKKS